MKEKEKQLFKALCRFRDKFRNTSLTEFATPDVLGLLFFNRMQGVAYGTLERNSLLGEVNREFRNSLHAALEQNIQKNRSYGKCVSELSGIISDCNCNVAMLKGAYLFALYPDGYRTSNDIDLLVLPKDVTQVGNLLAANGFVQGYVQNGVFVPATRHEIIKSRMTRGETVPYIKEVNLPFMKFLEVDINFSLGYKNENDNIISDMLSNTCKENRTNFRIPTLCDTDFFIHLCAHLYKEATTLPWIEMRRDMTLYKYCDIYMLLSEMSDDRLQKVFTRASELGMEKICSYAVLETMDIFDMQNGFARKTAEKLLEDDPEFRLRVNSPKDKKVLIYRTSDATERFFSDFRKNDLREVNMYEKT